MLKKISIFFSVIAVSLLLVSPTTLVYGGDQPPGKPFEYLNSRVDDLENRTGSLEERLSQAEAALEALKDRVEKNEGDIGDLYASIADLEEEIANIKDEMQHNGKKVSPGLYEVHTRVLWDIGWLKDDSLLSGGYFTYWEQPKNLVYANNRTTFLSPLKGYGIPEVQPGATRKARLYVYYGHQWMCGGTPTIRIGDVEFSLPLIGGYYGDMATHWSNYLTYDDYEHVGHTGIQVYMKDFYYDGPHCGPYPGTGPDRPKGVIYKIVAHFYDEFLE